MPFVGFDRELLDGLRSAMIRSLDELMTIRSGLQHGAEHAAGGAIDRLNWIDATLRHSWLPAVDQLLACSALDERRPVDRYRAGWHVVVDQLERSSGDATGWTLTIADVGALADGLARGQQGLLDTAPQRRTLMRTLHSITADPALLAAFRAALGDDERWAVMFDRLGLARIVAATEQPAEIASLDATIEALADVYAAGPHEGRVGWYPVITELVEPYTAALLLGRLHLGGTMLALVAHQVLVRWADHPTDGGLWIDQEWPGDNTADLLFAQLADHPEAAVRFLTRCADRPGLLVLTAEHDARVEELLVAGTNPRIASSAEAGRIIVALIDELRRTDWTMVALRDGVTPSAHALMGTIIGPWLLQFGPRADEWGWDARQGDDALRWVISDADAAERLTVGSEVWVAALAGPPLIGSDGRTDVRRLHELGELFVQLELAFRDEQIAEATAARFWTDATFFTIDLVAPWAAGGLGGPVAGVAGDVAAEVVSPRVRAILERTGMIPPGAGETSVVAQARFGDRMSDIAVVAVAATVTDLVAAGRLPATAVDALEGALAATDGDRACAADDTGHALRTYVEGLAGDLDPLTFESLVLITDVFASPATGRLLCDQRADPT